MLELRRDGTVQRGLARMEDGAAAAAEERLRRAVEAVATLDAEVEALSAGLADFSRIYEAALGELQSELEDAERVVRSLQALEDALSGLAASIEAGEVRPSRRGRRRPAAGRSRREQGARETAPGPVPPREPTEAALKRVYRRLARLLHPDLARDEEEAHRLGGLMARVNAAYAAGDLAALEVLAERHGAGELPDADPRERLLQLERRAVTMERIAASLARERDLLRRSDTFRLREEHEADGDFLERSRREIAQETADARADVLARLLRVDRAARRLSHARSRAMNEIVRSGPSAARRAFDPLRESAVVRAGASRLDRARATAAARELARWMEDAAVSTPWQAALTLLAFFAEDAGARPPPSLDGAEAWADTWEHLRAAWPDAPELPRVLERLPRHLTAGARLQGQVVVAGVQLATAELAAGVRISLARDRVAAIARAALAALGPSESCPSCKVAAPALHRLRTRGLDEHHGLGCSACGAMLRSYWRYGEVDGLEALAPHALDLGLVAEVTVDLAGTSLGFQMLPSERDALTAERLRRAFAELYLAPYEVELAASDVVVAGPAGPLAPRARLAGVGDLRLASAREDLPAEELLELLRARIERRFRP